MMTVDEIKRKFASSSENEIYKWVILHGYPHETFLYLAARHGMISVVKLLIDKGISNLNPGLCGACEGGHVEIIDRIIERGANDVNRGMFSACYGGHLAIVNKMIDKGANAWDWGLDSACEGGNLAIVDLMVQKGATDFVTALNDLHSDRPIYYSIVCRYYDRIKDKRVLSYDVMARVKVNYLVVFNRILPPDLARVLFKTMFGYN